MQVGSRSFYLNIVIIVPVLVLGVMLAEVASGSAIRGGESRLIGAERCGSCHRDQYEAWKHSHHFRAYSALDEHERHDPRCYGCHTLSLEDGYRNVQCETCHGPGRYYAKTMVMRDKELRKVVGLVIPDKKICNRCHTEDAPNIIPFDPREKMEIIKHWNIEAKEGEGRDAVSEGHKK
ncbi:MAG: hypothetical protein GXP49_16965 [Deltaproteobacteria bacterium]|nr:hypothetical protein [Deltaproteobacteria bacterium]